jgi:hypothetical protein
MRTEVHRPDRNAVGEDHAPGDAVESANG